MGESGVSAAGQEIIHSEHAAVGLDLDPAVFVAARRAAQGEEILSNGGLSTEEYDLGASLFTPGREGVYQGLCRAIRQLTEIPDGAVIASIVAGGLEPKQQASGCGGRHGRRIARLVLAAQPGNRKAPGIAIALPASWLRAKVESHPGEASHARRNPIP